MHVFIFFTLVKEKQYIRAKFFWKSVNSFFRAFLGTKFSAPEAYTIRLFTAVIYGFRNKLECLSLNTRLGWKGLPVTKTLAYYEKP
jgi:hypothetical protein